MQIGKAWNNTGSQGVQSPAGWPSGHRCHYEPSARELFPQKFKTGTAAIVPAASGQSEPEKFAEPGTFRQFMHPERTWFQEGFDRFGVPTYSLAEIIWTSLLYQTRFGGLP